MCTDTVDRTGMRHAGIRCGHCKSLIMEIGASYFSVERIIATIQTYKRTKLIEIIVNVKRYRS